MSSAILSLLNALPFRAWMFNSMSCRRSKRWSTFNSNCWRKCFTRSSWFATQLDFWFHIPFWIWASTIGGSIWCSLCFAALRSVDSSASNWSSWTRWAWFTSRAFSIYSTPFSSSSFSTKSTAGVVPRATIVLLKSQNNWRKTTRDMWSTSLPRSFWSCKLL